MKNLYCKIGMVLCGLILMTMNLNAQEVDTTYAARMNYIFQNMDKSKVPFGLLKDAALEMAELNYYRGTVLLDSNRVYAENFKDIYFTLATAQIHASVSATLPTPDLIDSTWFAKRQPGQVTLAGLYYKYSRYADDAANKVSILNDQVYDKYVNGVWQNPYTTEQVMAFAPASIDYPNTGFSMYLPPELWLSNQKDQVSAIQCDASDGLGYRALQPGVSFPVFYADSGLKVLKFKIILLDNTILQSHSIIHVSKSPYYYQPNNILPGSSFKPNNPVSANFIPAGLQNCINGNADANGIEKLMMTSTESYNGKLAKGLITVKYAKPDHLIHKPLIVVEGFDPGDPEDYRGVYNIDKFQADLLKSNSSQLQELLLYSPDYDIIFIDWKNGTEDMRLNALLVKTVIRCINQVKVDIGEQNVVLGLSMGGVIARYALKKMEDAGENHDTRLYISHDAPHQGANVPLGFQAANLHAQTIAFRAIIGTTIYRAFGGKKDNMLYLINSPAAKQLLSNRLSLNYAIDYSFVLNNINYDAWQNELKALGYPQNCRNIAISNGSECGAPYPILPEEHLYLWDGFYKGRFLGDFLGSLALPILGVFTSQIEMALLGLIPGSNKFAIHFEVNPMASGGGNLVYKGKIVYKKKILWFIPVQTTIANKSYSAPAGFNAIDTYPGGVRLLEQTDKIHNPNIDDDINLFYTYNYHLIINSGFSFISTTSALDIGKGQVPLTLSDYYSPYVGANPPIAPKNTPFANFITAYSSGAGNNEEHISYSQRNGNWLAAELNKQVPAANCISLCTLSSNSISGPATLCGTTTYSFTNPPVGANISWYTSGTIQINGANNQNSVSIKQLGNGSGTISASISLPGTDCGEKLISRTITSSGAPAYQNITGQYFNNGGLDFPSIIYNPNVYPVNGIEFSVPYVNGVSYQWMVNGQVYGGTQDNSVIVYAPQCGYGFPTYQIFSAKVKMTNGCGSTTQCMEFQFYCNPTKHLEALGSCEGPVAFIPEPVELFLISPNPAGDELKIAYTENLADKLPDEVVNPFEVTLYDEKSSVLLSAKSREGERQIVLDTRTLPDGIYYLHIQQGRELIKKQVIIRHE